MRQHHRRTQGSTLLPPERDRYGAVVTAAFVLARAGLRRGLRPLLGLSLVLALGLGVTIASLEAAARTERAYPSYLRRAEVGQLVVNPSLNTARAAEIIASTPGVKGYASDSLLTATSDGGDPTKPADVGSDATQVLLSTDGRYTEQDRPVVHEGRMVRSGAAEVFVNVEMAEALGLDVGETLRLAFWTNIYDIPDVARPSGPVEPLGRTEATIVGIGVFPDEVLVDGLYPRRRALVTPEVGAAFDCTPAQPSSDDPRPLGQLAESLVPRDCSTSYRYFSLRVDDGDRGVGDVVGALSARFAEENERLPPALRANDIGFEVIPTVTAEERERVQSSLDPAVTALRLFGAGAGASTLVVVLLGAVRIARREEHDARIWRALGATRPVRTAGIAVPLAAAAGAGLAASLVVAWLASGLGPVASARALDPTGRLGLSLDVLVVVLVGSTLVLAGGIAVGAAVASRATLRSEPASTPRSSLAVARTTTPALALGSRAATARAGGRALLGASVAAVTAVLATLVFSASISGLVTHPERFGWPYDMAATVNFGYGGTTDRAAIEATLDRPEVARWGLAALAGGLAINGETIPVVAARPGFEAMRLPVVEGELPVAGDEIALGTKTARRLGLGVGDKVLVQAPEGEREGTVRGLVVMPPLGPFLADRASLGTGALLPAAFVDALLDGAAGEAGLEPGQLADTLAGFVAVDLRPGTDPQRFLAAISNQLTTWDSEEARPFTYAEPVRPATVANAAAMRAVPVALAALFAMTMAIALMLAIAVATRARRRELAVLRALGCVGRQLRATVRWHALTVTAVGLVVGIPVGLALGRVAFRAFATGLGVLPDPEVPVSWVLVLVLATLGLGLLAAVGPGHRAARVTAAEVLRNE